MPISTRSKDNEVPSDAKDASSEVVVVKKVSLVEKNVPF
jgi:hypothetical protein